MSNNGLGRNDLCSCGSGKKYKKCCLLTATAPSFEFSKVADFGWRKLRQLEGAVFDKHLIPYVMEKLPKRLMQFALEDCLPEDLPEQIDQGVLFHQFLMPWIFFNWIPESDLDIKNYNESITLAENYLSRYKKQLNNDESRFIEAMLTTYYSFYTILAVEKNQSLLVKDILLGSTHEIKERQGTHFLKRGDIVFTRILTLDDQSIFVGMAPLTLPPEYHMKLLDFKKWLVNDHQPLDGQTLRNELDLDLYDYFFDGIIEAYNKPFPTLLNTDGELFQLTSSHFKLKRPLEEVLPRLISMTLSDDLEEFIQGAKRDKAGKMTEIEFPWLKLGNKQHKSWENTVCGDVIMKQDKLVLKTNSLERAEQGGQLLEKLLGDAVEFQSMMIESMEQMMKSSGKAKNKQDSQLIPESNVHLAEDPEIREKIAAMAKSHWDDWFDMSIPALEHQTPRQAAKTPEGRERLEALLLQIERMNAQKQQDDPFRADIDLIKATLALEN